jgi:hypothetical protein
MSDFYLGNYLNNLLTAIIIVTVITLIIYLLYKLPNSKNEKKNLTKKDNNKTIKEFKKYSEGNISIFFDRDDNVIIIPYVKDMYGRGKPVEKIIKLNYPYNYKEIGEAAASALDICTEKIPGNIKNIIKKQGYNSWVKFSKEMRSISVQYKNKSGFIFYATKNLKNGKFIIRNDQKSKIILNTLVEEREIGLEIIQLKTLCE